MYKKKMDFARKRRTRSDKGRKRGRRGGMSTSKKVAIGTGIAAAGAAGAAGAVALRRRGAGGPARLPGAAAPKALASSEMNAARKSNSYRNNTGSTPTNRAGRSVKRASRNARDMARKATRRMRRG